VVWCRQISFSQEFKFSRNGSSVQLITSMLCYLIAIHVRRIDRTLPRGAGDAYTSFRHLFYLFIVDCPCKYVHSNLDVVKRAPSVPQTSPRTPKSPQPYQMTPRHFLGLNNSVPNTYWARPRLLHSHHVLPKPPCFINPRRLMQGSQKK
jgi:hypothetical protein